MKPVTITGKGSIHVTPLGTGETSIQVDCGRGQMGVMLDRNQVSELCVALIAVLRSAKRRERD